MRVESRKFNAVIEMEDDKVIQFPFGLIGFAEEKEFVLLEREQSPRIAWLQSVHNPDLALPVVSGHELGEDYPDVPLAEAVYADRIGPMSDETALMLVLTCQHGLAPTINMMSPIVVDAKTRTGAQLILQGTRFASREVLTLRPYADEGPPSNTYHSGAPL
ncbi:MAG TPA: flagellar assembly protein FliW [Polyangiaceae bacterium]|jgi:flagellar assembly factor FliW|nr:flagellar assembly protein FliW [Polyangiaceae bacterium]